MLQQTRHVVWINVTQQADVLIRYRTHTVVRIVTCGGCDGLDM